MSKYLLLSNKNSLANLAQIQYNDEVRKNCRKFRKTGEEIVFKKNGITRI